MTGYVRNDVSDNISFGNVIDADDLDGEFNAIQTAFSNTGHTHDGSVGNGGPISVLGPAKDITVSSTLVVPRINNTISIGSATLKYKDGHFDGVIYNGGLTISNNKNIYLTDNGDNDTRVYVDAPDITGSTEAEFNFWRNTSGNVEVSFFKGNNTGVKNHSFFNNSVLLARDGTGTVTIGSDTSGTENLNIVGTQHILTDSTGEPESIIFDNQGGGTGNKIVSTKGLTIGSDYENNSNSANSYISFEVDQDEKFRINAGSTVFYATNVDMPNLPTSDPGVAGRLWNNSGVLTISAG